MSVPVATKELAEELHRLSGWETFDVLCQSGSYRQTYGEESDRGWFSYDPNDAVAHHQNKFVTYQSYDLGYLLRRFQDEDLTIVMRWNRDMGGRIAMKEWDRKYCIGTFDMPQGDYPIADTPEDAACQLAIELFKQGVLKRQEPAQP